MDEYRCEARTTPLTRNDDDIWFICRYRVEIYSNGGQIVITVQLLRCWIFDPGEGEDEASLTLDCAGGPGDVPLPRGSTASCAASLERGNEDAGEAVFEWESNDTTWTDSSGTGASNWGGVATNTTDITVTVITGDEVKDTLSETVTVSVEARKWPFQYVSAPWGFSSQITSMALYDLPLAPSTVPPASEGSGPWEGQFYMASPPQAHPTIWIHSDYSGAAGPQEPGASNTCAAAANLASANLYKVNDACNRLSAMLASETPSSPTSGYMRTESTPA